MGIRMTREEELKRLKAMCDTLALIPEEERFDYFFNNSPTFRKDVSKLGFLKNAQFLTSSDFKFKEGSLLCPKCSIPKGISSLSTEMRGKILDTEIAKEDSEWEMITEAA